ncbi:hypothetical protein F5X99DRAFT_423848 [Biscogniauxia marginata]|nr:hypothetical protein F5X99DRAFT_423848 [Biscogniauxia marginata]
MTADGSLDVIALVSGGKDSFFSILHCLANGHRIVALANLYPPLPTARAGAEDYEVASNTARDSIPGAADQQHGSFLGRGIPGGEASFEDEEEMDLNSFMYQTVGHQVIPLYAQATGLPLFRQPIVGTAVHHGISYQDPHDRQTGPQQSIALSRSAGATDSVPNPSSSSSALASSHGGHGAEGDKQPQHVDEDEDETESLVPLLRAVMRAHPEANALCTGAILSTYQRTRIESVALRLGLVPLAYIWQFPELPLSSLPPPPGLPPLTTGNLTLAAGSRGHPLSGTGVGNDDRDDAQLLRDMAAAGLDARIIKVASAGLDESFLWENVASATAAARVERAMWRFGGGGRGSVLGEGGEFETLVVDGPAALFKGRVVVRDEARRVVREGGGCAWLSIREAKVEMKGVEQPQGVGAAAAGADDLGVRIPNLLDPRFEAVVAALRTGEQLGFASPSHGAQPSLSNLKISGNVQYDRDSCQEWCFVGGSRGRESPSPTVTTVEDQTAQIVDEIRTRLREQSLPATAITNSIIVLRRMSDFALVNKHYGSLFREPNPPSRVTISCGDVLAPPDAAVAIYLSVQPYLKPEGADHDNNNRRRGLHVQSRSYWAPANIGPYSQAIAFPLLPHHRRHLVGGSMESASSPPLAVSIAGQIPLIPASMTLPSFSSPNADDDIRLQIGLALQHLWRVGAEVQVRWWTSAVAYFPRATATNNSGVVDDHQNNNKKEGEEGEEDPRRQKALLVATAWRAAHLRPRIRGSSSAAAAAGDENDEDEDEDEDEEETGPDLWDRRYNPLYRSYAGDYSSSQTPPSAPTLPDWDAVFGVSSSSSSSSSTLSPGDDDDDGNYTTAESMGNIKKRKQWERRARSVPPVFAAEVDELPRAAGVEWHAHAGLAGVGHGAVRLWSGTEAWGGRAGGSLELHHVFVVVVDDPSSSSQDSSGGLFVQSTAVLKYHTGEADHGDDDVIGRITALVAAGLRELLLRVVEIGGDWDAAGPKITYADASCLGRGAAPPGAFVPCRSLWDSRGDRLAAVAIYETRLV